MLEGATYTDWETIYNDNVVRVYRLMFARVGNRPDAEDLTSEVFVKSLPNLSLPSPVMTLKNDCQPPLAKLSLINAAF